MLTLKSWTWLLIFLLGVPALAQAQAAVHQFSPDKRGKEALRVVSYNVENLFDTQDDALAGDDNFTPSGIRGWSDYRYHKKLNQIAKVIISVGGWEAPGIVGLQEIENRQALNELVNSTPIQNYNYQIVHEESPDHRGIDVALIYREGKFKLIDYQTLEVIYPGKSKSTTREILYVKGQALASDTLHIFVNHWPSKYGGHLETDPKRAAAANVVRKAVDSIYNTAHHPKIMIMGDLNDTPLDESLTEHLKAYDTCREANANCLVNLFYSHADSDIGTHYYKDIVGEWSILDHLIVSPWLLSSRSGVLKIENNQPHIYRPHWLLTDDMVKPYRSFYGMDYLGGFSDHLPVFMDLKK